MNHVRRCVYTILFMARRMKTYRDRDRNRHADRILKLTSGVIIRNNKEYLMLRDPETDTQTKKRAETINRQADRQADKNSLQTSGQKLLTDKRTDYLDDYQSRGEKGRKKTRLFGMKTSSRVSSALPKSPTLSSPATGERSR